MKRRDEVTLFSRHEKMLNKRFPAVVDVLTALKGDFVRGGEVIALASRENHGSIDITY